jgi:hypothetical protein
MNRKEVRTLVRFQTRLANLLDEQLPDIADLNWQKLVQATGVSEPTLRAWYEARVGSDVYLNDYKGSTAAKIVAFLGLSDVTDLIEVVFDEESEFPQFNQEMVSAAVVA